MVLGYPPVGSHMGIPVSGCACRAPVHYLQLKLFDTLILPILTYGCEVWEYNNVQVLEKIRLQFCRNILKIRTSTPSFMSYGEIDRVPIDVVINVRMICFWNKLLTYNQQLSSILYRIMYMLSQRENVNFKWINHIKSIFDNVVMFGINKIQFI